MNNQMIKGYIISLENNQPLSEVHIVNKSMQGLSNGATTDAKGYYVLYANPTDEIFISHVSHKKRTMLARDMSQTIYLEPEIQELDEVIVTPNNPKPNTNNITKPRVSVTPSHNQDLKKYKKIAGFSLFGLGVLLLFMKKKGIKKVAM